jgi:hypothetical protein
MHMLDKPQTNRAPQDEFDHDLHPDHMAGQNLGNRGEDDERSSRTAFDVKDLHRALEGFNDDELKQIPVLDGGARLRQGATYMDLDRKRSEFTATGQMAVEHDRAVVPKDRVPYWLWNRLKGEEKR